MVTAYHEHENGYEKNTARNKKAAKRLSTSVSVLPESFQAVKGTSPKAVHIPARAALPSVAVRFICWPYPIQRDGGHKVKLPARSAFH